MTERCSSTQTVSGLKSKGFFFFISTQFLGAFNDNAFKFMTIGFAMGMLSEDASRNYLPLASSMFILPFLLFSSYAGFLADRFSKKTVMIWTKVLEVVIMVAGFAMFLEEEPYWLLLVLFTMGAQSTFFSPGKYGYLPETLPDRQLSAGNGYVQLFTFLAIIAGGGIGSHLVERYAGQVHVGAWYCVAVAVVGLLCSFGIGKTKPGNPSTRPSYDPITPHLRTFREIASDRLLLLACLGNTFFWLFGTVVQSNIPIVVKNDLQTSNTVMGYLQAALALGIGVGSALAGCLSKGKIAYHFVIPGGFCVAATALLCGLSSQSLTLSLIASALAGLATGFYQLPLSTTIQKRSPEDKRGSYLAACNALDCISMLVGTGIHWVLLKPLNMSGGGVLVVMSFLVAGFMLVFGKAMKTTLHSR